MQPVLNCALMRFERLDHLGTQIALKQRQHVAAAHLRAERARFLGEQLVEGVDIDLGPLELGPGVFQMIGGVGAPDDVDGQTALGLVPRERLERRARQHAAKIKDHSLDRQDPALVNSFRKSG